MTKPSLNSSLSVLSLALLGVLPGGTVQAQQQQQPGQPASAASPKAATAPAAKPYVWITGSERFKWFMMSTVGPTSLLGAGPLSAGWGTLFNSPPEYGPGWEGFGKRYGMRLTGVSTGNAIEALTGAALHEDPRYIPAPPGTSFGKRVGRIIGHTFLAYRPDGTTRFSYSRVAGNVGNNFLSNLWRVESENSAGDAALRCVWGLTGRMGGNAFAELWPSVAKKLKRK
ncbi:MAG: hypothetical protein HY821_25080 [Acidobacteria bacterium]|nr:hypothetical protein [Acidobacteriota bacterium]